MNKFHWFHICNDFWENDLPVSVSYQIYLDILACASWYLNHRRIHCLFAPCWSDTKDNVKAPRNWSLVERIHRWLVDSITKGQQRRESVNVMSLSLTRNVWVRDAIKNIGDLCLDFGWASEQGSLNPIPSTLPAIATAELRTASIAERTVTFQVIFLPVNAW